ncbi:MAG: LysM peptidoglycan-binding domain-containing protein [Planctomycetes bacterium]|nr:LysM peptidoglycan-binding domain-containing protein [Planctomycetota bacterium]
MRPLVLLGALALVLAALAVWRSSAPVEATRTIQLTPGKGVVVLGLETPSNQGKHVSESIPSVPPPPTTNDSGQTPTLIGTTNQELPEATTTQTAPDEDVAPTAPSAQYYVIKKDDTLFRILERFYGKATMDLVDAVAEANDMDDPSDLSINQRLILPLVKGQPAPRKP